VGQRAQPGLVQPPADQKNRRWCRSLPATTTSEDHQRRADHGDGRHHLLPRTRSPQLPPMSLSCVHVRCTRPFTPPPLPNSPRRLLPTYEAQFDTLLTSRRRRLYKWKVLGRSMLRPVLATPTSTNTGTAHSLATISLQTFNSKSATRAH
jgi:hypothetical protein